jgi:hypothetical protein
MVYSLCRFVLEGAKGLKRRLVRGIVRTKGIALELSLTVLLHVAFGYYRFFIHNFKKKI